MEQQEISGITSLIKGTIAQGSGESGHVKGVGGPTNGASGQKNGETGQKSAVTGLKTGITRKIRVVLGLVLGITRMRSIRSQAKVALSQGGGIHHFPCQAKGNLI